MTGDDCRKLKKRGAREPAAPLGAGPRPDEEVGLWRPIEAREEVAGQKLVELRAPLRRWLRGML